MTDTFPITAQALPGDIASAARVLEAQFGDGYAQRSGDGLNAVEQSTQATFHGTVSVIDAAADFLKARAGHTPFFYKPLGEATAKKFVCKKWTRSKVSPETHLLRCAFEEDFSL